MHKKRVAIARLYGGGCLFYDVVLQGIKKSNQWRGLKVLRLGFVQKPNPRFNLQLRGLLSVVTHVANIQIFFYLPNIFGKNAQKKGFFCERKSLCVRVYVLFDVFFADVACVLGEQLQ